MVIKNNNTLHVLFGLLALLIATELMAMDFPTKTQELRSTKQSENVFVKTEDGKIVAVRQQNINQMNRLLEQQKGENSEKNPIDASMVTAKELQLLIDALNAAQKNEFGKFYEGISQGLRIGTVGEGDLRLLINAAQRVEATGLSALCSSYFLPPDMQRLLIPTFIQPSIECLKNLTIKKYAEYRKSTLAGHQADVLCAVFSPDGTQIVSGSNGNKNNLIIWDASTGEQIRNLVGHPSHVRTVAWSPDGTQIVSGSEGNQNNLIIWDAVTGEQIHNLVGHAENVYSIAWSADGSKIVSGSGGNQNNLIIWDANTGEQLHNLVGHNGSVYSVAFSPDGSKMAANDETHVILWDVVTGTQIRTFVGCRAFIVSIAFSPDGKKIVAGNLGQQNNLILWDANTGELIHNLVGHNGSVYSVAWSADGSKIVSGSRGNRNNTIIWDANTGKLISKLGGFAEKINSVIINSVAFSPDDNKIVLGIKGKKNNLILWTLFTDQEEKILNDLNNCTVAQARLLHQLCLASQQETIVKLTDSDAHIFNSLPQLVRSLLQENVVVPIENKLPTRRRVQIRRRPAPQLTDPQVREQQDLAQKKEEI